MGCEQIPAAQGGLLAHATNCAFGIPYAADIVPPHCFGLFYRQAVD
jgi:hypothetical protein